MNLPTFEHFEADARAAGYDEVIVREWPPALVLETHTHPFAVRALVVRGSFTLVQGERTRQLDAGDRFELAREAPHAEHYGAEGATFWVARRHAAG
jgi:quercetin dioxygenase-like cupin family protein